MHFMFWKERELPVSRDPNQVAKRVRRAGLEPNSRDFIAIMEDGVELRIASSQIPGLESASFSQLNNFEIPGHGYSIRWDSEHVEILVENYLRLNLENKKNTEVYD